MKKILIYLTILTASYEASAQVPLSTGWTPISSPRGSFSFTLPASRPPVDTLKLLSYSYILSTDSSINFQVDFIDSAAISANPELQSLMTMTGTPANADTIALMLNLYANMYGQLTNGTVEGFDSVSYSTNIKGRELTIRHPDLVNGTTNYYFDFTRYYYYRGKFLIFTVSGPESKLTDLYAYKNQLFGSIAMSW